VDDEADMNAENDDVEVPHPAGGADVAIDTVPPNGIGTAQWRNRRDAYRTLEALADYLGDVEPHSPTPFLLRRAASWGRMSLPEVIADIIREEGDVARLFQVLGMKV
jgi:type VI secretion system protein ImpA